MLGVNLPDPNPRSIDFAHSHFPAVLKSATKEPVVRISAACNNAKTGSCRACPKKSLPEPRRCSGNSAVHIPRHVPKEESLRSIHIRCDAAFCERIGDLPYHESAFG